MIKRLKELEAGNSGLKKIYAKERINAEIRKDVLGGKAVESAHRSKIAQSAIEKHRISVGLAPECLGISETCFRFRAKLSCENVEVVDWLLRLTDANKR